MHFDTCRIHLEDGIFIKKYETYSYKLLHVAAVVTAGHCLIDIVKREEVVISSPNETTTVNDSYQHEYWPQIMTSKRNVMHCTVTKEQNSIG